VTTGDIQDVGAGVSNDSSPEFRELRKSLPVWSPVKIHCVELTWQCRYETQDELFQYYRANAYRELAATGHRNVLGEHTSRYAETSPQTYRPNRTTKQTLASRR